MNWFKDAKFMKAERDGQFTYFFKACQKDNVITWICSNGNWPFKTDENGDYFVGLNLVSRFDRQIPLSQTQYDEEFQIHNPNYKTYSLYDC